MMNFTEIKKLIDMVVKSGIAEIEVKEGEKSIRVNNVKTIAGPASSQGVVVDTSVPVNNNTCIDLAATPTLAKEDEYKYTVNAPMVGTVYLSPAPGVKHFVEAGQQVKVGDTLCLIEAMKMFNRIEADKPGVIKAVLIDNSQPVEYGQALFAIE